MLNNQYKDYVDKNTIYMLYTLSCIYIYSLQHMCMYTHSYVSSCKCIPLKIYADFGRGYKYFFKGMYIVCTTICARVCSTYTYMYTTQVRTYIYKIFKYIHTVTTYQIHTPSFSFRLLKRRIDEMLSLLLSE